MNSRASVHIVMGDFIKKLVHLSCTVAFTKDGMKVHSCVR